MNEIKNMVCDVATTAQTENVTKIEKIRVNSGITVEVNDNGDTITIPVDDMQFMDRFYGMINQFQDAANRLSAVKTEETKEQLRAIIEECNKLTEEIDAVFGAGCCKKVFGDMVPNPYLVIDFFNQLKPIVGRYASARQSKIAQKYNSKRQGTKKKHYYQKRK